MTEEQKADYKREYMKKYHAIHRKQRNEAVARYKANNPEKAKMWNRISANRRRDRLKNEAGE